MFKLYYSSSLWLLLLVFFASAIIADEIYIYGPPQNGIYHPTDIMDIRYRVRSIGMTRIWSTSAKLVHIESNYTIAEFPKMNRLTLPSSISVNNDTTTIQQQDEQKGSLHSSWTIPANIPIGNYSLIIAGNATYLCSKNGNGSAPFKHCSSVIYKSTSFFITNGTMGSGY